MDRLHAVAVCLILAMMLVPLPVASGEPTEEGEEMYGPVLEEVTYDEDGSVHWYRYAYIVWFWDDNGVLQRLFEGARYTVEHYEYIIINLGTNSRSDVLTDAEGNLYEAGDHVFIYKGDEYTTHGIVAKVYADTELDLYVPADGDSDTLTELWRVPIAAGALAVLYATLHRRRRRV